MLHTSNTALLSRSFLTDLQGNLLAHREFSRNDIKGMLAGLRDDEALIFTSSATVAGESPFKRAEIVLTRRNIFAVCPEEKSWAERQELLLALKGSLDMIALAVDPRNIEAATRSRLANEEVLGTYMCMDSLERLRNISMITLGDLRQYATILPHGEAYAFAELKTVADQRYSHSFIGLAHYLVVPNACMRICDDGATHYATRDGSLPQVTRAEASRIFRMAWSTKSI